VNPTGLLTLPGLLLCIILPALTITPLCVHLFRCVPGVTYRLDQHGQPFGYRWRWWMVGVVIVVIMMYGIGLGINGE